MKSSLIRSFVIFAAGAATAALASGLYPKEPITAGQFRERISVLVTEVEALGAYVAIAENGRIGLYTDPYACIPPRPPVPVLPYGAVDSRTLRTAAFALMVYNEGVMHGETDLVYEVGRCKPYATSTLIRK
jgi:hypothetical protein